MAMRSSKATTASSDGDASVSVEITYHDGGAVATGFRDCELSAWNYWDVSMWPRCGLAEKIKISPQPNTCAATSFRLFTVMQWGLSLLDKQATTKLSSNYIMGSEGHWGKKAAGGEIDVRLRYRSRSRWSMFTNPIR